MQDIFADLTSKGINGESQRMPNLIEILSVSHTANNVSGIQTGAGHGTQRVQIGLVHFSAYVEKAAPKMMESLWKADVFPTIKVHFKQSVAANQTSDYYTLTLTNAVIQDMSIGAATGDTKATMNFAVSAGQIEHTSYVQDTASGSVSMAYDTTYNVLTATVV